MARPLALAVIFVAGAAAAAPWDAMNLGFEELDKDGRPAGWTADAAAQPSTTAHGGARSLLLTAPGSARVSVDGSSLIGKRVRVHGWIKTEGVTGGEAAIWLATRMGSSWVDHLKRDSVSGTTDWREVESSIVVPTGAGTIAIGPLLTGQGRAWFDDLRVEIEEIAAPRPVTLRGRVVDASGHTLAGASIALMRATGAVDATTRCDAAGTFRIETATGIHRLSASHPAGVAALSELLTVTSATPEEITLTLKETGGVEVRGHVEPGSVAIPAGAFLEIGGSEWAYITPVATDGAFDVKLPSEPRYVAYLRAPGLAGSAYLTTRGARAEGTLRVTGLGPPPEEVVAWLKREGVPLTTPEAGHGFDDLRPFGRMIGTARIVGLGEATHGTREFFQLKHRLLEYLVAEHGFTLFAIEANQPECRALNEYVLGGEGDVLKLIAGMHFWTWSTQEVRDMVEWMRAWNADPKHKKKLQFTGFDAQYSSAAFANVKAAMTKVDSPAGLTLLDAAASLARDDADVPPAQVAAVKQALAELGRLMDQNGVEWRKLLGARAFVDARHDVRVLEQQVAIVEPGANDHLRDQVMAENLSWILDQEPPGTRAVLWAHNRHLWVHEGAEAMGKYLRQRHGKGYVIVGFAFSEGGFQARAFSDGAIGELRAFELPAPGDEYMTSPFTRTGHPILAVDLRRAPRGRVAEWFAGFRPVRVLGAVFSQERAIAEPSPLTPDYDVIVFVQKTTRARPLMTERVKSLLAPDDPFLVAPSAGGPK